MVAAILVLTAGAAVAVLAAWQWDLSGQALTMAHTSQELLDFFANRVLLADEHLVSSFERVEPGTSTSWTSRHSSRRQSIGSLVRWRARYAHKSAEGDLDESR